MNKCNVCRNVFFKNENEKQLHLIRDSHIKRYLKPNLWSEIDETNEKINSLLCERAETNDKKQKKLITSQLRPLWVKKEELNAQDYGIDPKDLNKYLCNLENQSITI